MEKKFISIGTEQLAYLDEGKGETILLIHGNMSSSVHYSPLIDRLKDKFRCVAPDMRGFGDSSYNNRFDSLKELAEDINLFMDKLGIDSAYVVGWSTGGGVALELAALAPNKVKALFSVEGAGCKGYPLFVKDSSFKATNKIYASKEEMANDPVQVAPALAMLNTKNTFAMGALWDAAIYTVNKPNPEDNELWLSETVKQRNLIDVDWALANFNMTDEANAYTKGNGRINDVKCPVGLTLAENDLVVPDYMVMDNYNALKDNAKLYLYPKCGHSPLVDCPDKLAKDITEFFTK